MQSTASVAICLALWIWPTPARPRATASEASATRGFSLQLGPSFATVWQRHGGVTPLDALDLEAGDRDTLEDAGVRWLLPIGESPVRAVLLLGRRLAGAWLGTHEQRELERFAAHLDVAV